MSMVLVALAIKVLIASHGFPCHLIRPFKVWFVLDFLQYLMYWFLEHSTIAYVLVAPDCPTKSFLERLLLYQSDLKSLIS